MLTSVAVGLNICTLHYEMESLMAKNQKPEFQSLNLAGYRLSGLNSGTETPASEFCVMESGLMPLAGREFLLQTEFFYKFKTSILHKIAQKIT